MGQGKEVMSPCVSFGDSSNLLHIKLTSFIGFQSADVLLNCQLLTQIIRGCSIDKSHPPAQSMPTVEKKPSCDRETASYLADVLVELVCPDVTFTGVLWPEEELTRLTIERSEIILHENQKFG